MTKPHGAREQKKLARQKAKCAARRKELARRSSANPLVRLDEADRWPVVASLVTGDLWSQGLGDLVFARRVPDGQLAVAVFLVDIYCLGVKNAFVRIGPASMLDDIRARIERNSRLKRVSPEYVSKLAHHAADYSQSLGFPPHRDFQVARLLLAGIDPSLCREDFQFGKDGRPFYIRGPGESIALARSIASRVIALGGDCLIPIAPGDEH